MTSLWILTINSVLQLVLLIKNLKLLKFLNKTTAIKYCIFYDSTHTFIMQVDIYLRTISRATAKVKISESSVWNLIIIISAFDFPWTMRCWYQYSLEKTDILLKSQIDFVLLFILGIGGLEDILIRKIAWHKRESNRHWER